MILNDIKVPVRYSEEQLVKAIRKAAGKKDLKIKKLEILRRSIDARKKPQLYYVMKLAVNELEPAREKAKTPVFRGRTVVVGAGPAGLFAALTIAEAGNSVILLERGKPVEQRTKDVEHFFETGALDPESNVQFGEGGAGTFSDGKLNTLTNDKSGLNTRVLRIFVEAGADPSICYDQKPHIGTDRLFYVVRALRERILKAGGEIRFETKMEELVIEDGRITGVKISEKADKASQKNDEITLLKSGKTTSQKSGEKALQYEVIPCERVILAVGHSARDTFYKLRDQGVPMEAKAFAVGVRMEHPQDMITIDQYGTPDYEELGAAPYKVTAKTSGGRGVYSFCMCPGGYVVNASSEPGRLCINGMSYEARDGKNANSGIVVQVTPEDYPSDDALAGIEFQRELERKAYEACKGRIPVQLYEDFRADRLTEKLGEIEPAMKGEYGFARLSEILPKAVNDAILEAVPKFGRMIRGFDRPDAVMSAVEARTSSPVRIPRDERGEASISGLYPCGEGAGYAGGITSAAMDGVRIAEKILFEE